MHLYKSWSYSLFLSFIIISNRLMREGALEEAAAFLHQGIKCAQFQNGFIHIKACGSICNCSIFPSYRTCWLFFLFFLDIQCFVFFNYCCFRKGLRCSSKEMVNDDNESIHEIIVLNNANKTGQIKRTLRWNWILYHVYFISLWYPVIKKKIVSSTYSQAL